MRLDVHTHFSTTNDHEIAIIGDRVLSDVVLGNSHGFFTILVEPLDLRAENVAVKLARKFENTLLRRLVAGKRPPEHPTVSYDKLSTLIKT